MEDAAERRQSSGAQLSAPWQRSAGGRARSGGLLPQSGLLSPDSTPKGPTRTPSSIPSHPLPPLLSSPAVTMSDQLKEIADVPKDFIKDGTLFINRCAPPWHDSWRTYTDLIPGAPSVCLSPSILVSDKLHAPSLLHVRNGLTLKQPTSASSSRFRKPSALDSSSWAPLATSSS